MNQRPLLTLAFLLLIGCSKPPADNLLFISFDTTRADRLSAYGYSQKTSPRIDALAQRGTLFLNAYSHAPSTLPTHASLFTGLLPPHHGVRANGLFQLSKRHRTLAEYLEDQGFETGAILGALPLDRRFGLDQGFGHYEGDFAAPADGRDKGTKGEDRGSGEWFGHRFTHFERRADRVSDLALGWLASRSAAKRWFLFVHYFDPHAPYDPPPAWAARFAHPYDAEIAFADHQLGRLLDAVDALPGKTLIVFTADHGEGLGEHGEKTHNRYLYNSTIRIPLVFVLDREVLAGRAITTPVAHVDVMPTVLELLGLGSPSSADGLSLTRALLQGEELESRPIYSETLEWKLSAGKGLAVRALIDEGAKLVRSDQQQEDGGFTALELYDLAGDPAEVRNLARHEDEKRDRLARRLAAWIQRLESEAFEPETYDLDERALEGLRSLGYLN